MSSAGSEKHGSYFAGIGIKKSEQFSDINLFTLAIYLDPTFFSLFNGPFDLPFGQD